jgi:hypothetical protein
MGGVKMAAGTSDEFVGEQEARDAQREAVGFLRVFAVAAMVVTSLFGLAELKGQLGFAVAGMTPLAAALFIGVGGTLAIARNQGAKLRKLQAQSFQVPTDRDSPEVQ